MSKGASDEDTRWIVDYMLEHECWHLNDWDSNKKLTLGERLELLSKIVARVQSEDRYKSDYVEGIHNEDPKQQLLNRCLEYFAVVGGVYCSDMNYALPVADREIFSALIAKLDPKYDRDRAVKARSEMLQVLRSSEQGIVAPASYKEINPIPDQSGRRNRRPQAHRGQKINKRRV